MTGPEVARIEIVKRFNDDAEGGMSVHVTYGDDLTLLDALGMLAFAQATAFDTYTNEEEA